MSSSLLTPFTANQRSQTNFLGKIRNVERRTDIRKQSAVKGEKDHLGIKTGLVDKPPSPDINRQHNFYQSHNVEWEASWFKYEIVNYKFTTISYIT